MRAIIRSAAGAGILPDQVRGMIPRDWLLVVRGLNDKNGAGRPGANAPSRAEVRALVEKYG